MEFITRVGAAPQLATDCIAVGVHAGGSLTSTARKLDQASKGALAAAVESGDATGRRGHALLLRALPGVKAARVLLVGLGKAEDFTDKAYAEAVRTAVKHAGAGTKQLALAAGDWKVKDRDAAWHARTLAAAARDTAAERGLREGTALANGMELTKRLGNLPPNICTPRYLAEQAKGMAREFDLDVDVLDRKDIEKLGMGAFLSVTRGSEEPPRLIVLKYQGAGKAAPTVLVGKGITFDSGGISIKPGANMDEMKYDMCGAGTVLGTMRAIAELKPKANVIGVVVACENMPSGTASRPGDIVTSMSGQTIEILNTDAEGRLILCDALTYVERFKPAAVIDIATLTGACVVALGDVNHGLFASDDALAEQLLAASRAALDPAWRMPVQEDYQEQIKSNFADMANIGPPGKAGAVLAACFLARFTKAYKWAHLDIAGTAWRGGAAKGATGRPVPLLVQYLSSH